ncbi:16288_t:CDS:1, partial [Cetraspora pellucida]
IDSSKNNLIFDFKKVSNVKDIQFSVEKKEKNSKLFSKEIENNLENEYYENKERSYINIWN